MLALSSRAIASSVGSGWFIICDGSLSCDCDSDCDCDIVTVTVTRGSDGGFISRLKLFASQKLVGDTPRKREDNTKREDQPLFFDSTPCEITPHYTPNSKLKGVPNLEITVKSGNWRAPPRGRPPPPTRQQRGSGPGGCHRGFRHLLLLHPKCNA